MLPHVSCLLGHGPHVRVGGLTRHADLKPLRAADHPAMYRISAPDNWAISFHRSALPSGQRVYYFAWSGIEHFFVDSEVDIGRELALLADLDDRDLRDEHVADIGHADDDRPGVGGHARARVEVDRE